MASPAALGDAGEARYTVEEPTDGISERSLSVDDGEVSTSSFDDLAQYLLALNAYRAKIDKELHNYQVGVKELQLACNKPSEELQELRTEHDVLSQAASAVEQSRSELIGDLATNAACLDRVFQTVENARQTLEEAVKTINNAQESLAGHPHTPTPSASPPRFRDSPDLKPEVLTELQGCLDKCKQLTSAQVTHKQWVIAQAEPLRDAHQTLHALMTTLDQQMFTSIEGLVAAVEHHQNKATNGRTVIAQVPMSLLVKFLYAASNGDLPSAVSVLHSTGDLTESPKIKNKLHTSPSRLPSGRQATTPPYRSVAPVRPKTPRSHRISPEHSLSPAPRRHVDSFAGGSPTARRMRGSSNPSRPGSGGSGKRTVPRYEPVDYSHVAPRVRSLPSRSGARSLTPVSRNSGRPATRIPAPTSPTSAQGAARSRPESTSGASRRQSRSSIERLSQPKRIPVAEYPYKGRAAQGPAGTRRRATTTSPPPYAASSERNLTSRVRTRAGLVAQAVRGNCTSRARPSRLSLPYSGLDTMESLQSLNDGGSMPAGSCASEAGSGTFPDVASFESLENEVQSACLLRDHEAIAQASAAPRMSPGSDLSTPNTLNTDEHLSQGGHTSISTGYGMLGFSGERLSPSTTASGGRVENGNVSGARVDTHVVESGLTSLEEITVEGGRGRSSEAHQGPMHRAASPHLPSVPAGAMSADQLRLNLTSVSREGCRFGSAQGSGAREVGDGAVEAWLSSPAEVGGGNSFMEGDTLDSVAREEASSILGRASASGQTLAEDTPRVAWDAQTGACPGDTPPHKCSPVRTDTQPGGDGRQATFRRRAAVSVLGPFPDKLGSGDKTQCMSEGNSLPVVPEEASGACHAPKHTRKQEARVQDNLRWLNSGGGQKENVAWNKTACTNSMQASGKEQDSTRGVSTADVESQL